LILRGTIQISESKFSEGIFDTSIADNWVPVDMYWRQSATMHLLYARFVHKFYVI
jgi:leucyl-tRNA synthetase